MFSSPPVEGENIRIPGRDGELYPLGGKRLGAGSFVVRMWMGAATMEQARADWESLLRTIVKRHRLVTWTHIATDGTARLALGEVVGKVDPTPIGQYGFRAQIEVSVPSGKWQDAQPRDTGPILINPGGIGGPINAIVYLPSFAGGSAPMTDLRVDVSGPIGAFKVTGVMPGLAQAASPWFRYDAPLEAPTDMSKVAVIVSGEDGMLVPDPSKFHYRGPYLFELGYMDSVEQHPYLRVEASSCSSQAAIRVYGKRSFLV
jgi:hypothetical protein